MVSVKALRALFVLGILGSLPSPGFTRDFGSYNEWEVSSDDVEHQCTLGREHEGPGSTVMGLTFDADDGVVLLFILNSNWSVSNGEAKAMGVRFDHGTEVYVDTAFGFSADGKHGLAMKISDKRFFQEFSADDGARFYTVGKNDDVVLLDYLDLSGTTAALAAFERCKGHVRGIIAADRAYQKKWEHIPTDPFAK